jgi:hypothetical protein
MIFSVRYTKYEHMGASTVKWTTPNPCLVFSENDSKLYTNFEVCEKRNHKHSRNILIYKAKQIMMAKKIPRKTYVFYKTVQVVCK